MNELIDATKDSSSYSLGGYAKPIVFWDMKSITPISFPPNISRQNLKNLANRSILLVSFDYSLIFRLRFVR